MAEVVAAGSWPSVLLGEVEVHDSIWPVWFGPPYCLTIFAWLLHIKQKACCPCLTFCLSTVKRLWWVRSPVRSPLVRSLLCWSVFYSVKWCFVSLTGALLPSHREWLQTHYSLKVWSLWAWTLPRSVCRMDLRVWDILQRWLEPWFVHTDASCFSGMHWPNSLRWEALTTQSFFTPHRFLSRVISFLFLFFVKRTQHYFPLPHQVSPQFIQCSDFGWCS